MEISERDGEVFFIAKNPKIYNLLSLAEKAGSTGGCVLLTGENGVGKRTIARKILCCFPQNDAEKVLFLDDVGHLSLERQKEVLRILRLDSPHYSVIATTEQDLLSLVKSKIFLSDLYIQLSQCVLNVPPLRERRDEIDDFCMLFLERCKRDVHKDFSVFSPEAHDYLNGYLWPGNIRELKNTVERACIIGQPPLIRLSDLGLFGSDAYADEAFHVPDKTLKKALWDFKAAYLLRLLRENHWNQTKVAAILNVQRTYVSRLIKELNVRR